MSSSAWTGGIPDLLWPGTVAPLLLRTVSNKLSFQGQLFLDLLASPHLNLFHLSNENNSADSSGLWGTK